jgi:hypothetical protein
MALVGVVRGKKAIRRTYGIVSAMPYLSIYFRETLLFAAARATMLPLVSRSPFVALFGPSSTGRQAGMELT